MKYIKKFDTVSAQTGYLTGTDLDTYVGYVGETQNVYYGDAIPEYKDRYFTIKSLTDNNMIRFNKNSSSNVTSLYTSTDGGNSWSLVTPQASSNQAIATLNAGEKLLIKGENTKYNYSRFSALGQFEVYGNVMSLISGDSFANADTITDTYALSGLFSGCTGLISAENLILPATTIADSCYRNMFDRCTSMKTSPKILPAMTLEPNCYRGMFALTKISKIPELPAMTLAESCYEYMFQLCNNLKVLSDHYYEHGKNPNAPKKLPATTLAPRCYANMFYECTGLTDVGDLYLPSTTLASECYFQMFRKCSNIMVSPKLPAPTLVYQCYRAMFAECSKLQLIRCYATDISATNCLYYWVGGVASMGTFFKSPDMNKNTYQRGQNGIPNNWVVRDATTC